MSADTTEPGRSPDPNDQLTQEKATALSRDATAVEVQLVDELVKRAADQARLAFAHQAEAETDVASALAAELTTADARLDTAKREVLNRLIEGTSALQLLTATTLMVPAGATLPDIGDPGSGVITFVPDEPVAGRVIPTANIARIHELLDAIEGRESGLASQIRNLLVAP